MATSPVTIPRVPLPRSLDVSINISRPQTEIATDMTMICFLSPEIALLPDNSRVAYFSTFQALEEFAQPGSSLWFAGNAFFSQSPRPDTMAVGRVFTDPVGAGLVSGAVQISTLRGITDGGFSISANDGADHSETIIGLDFSGVNSLDEAVSVLAVALPDWLKASNRNGSIVLQTVSGGDGVTIGYATEAGSGTEVGAVLGLTAETASNRYAGYTPGGLVAEAALVRTASRANGRQIYGWAIDRSWRDTQDQKDFSDWIEPQVPAVTSLVTNAVTAYNSGDTTNIGFHAYDKGYTRTSVFYHNNPQVYPDISYLARALSVNYSLADSTLTMKFKEMPGIETVPVTETMLSILNARRINTYTLVGNNSRTIREGVQSADTWFTDTIVNLDNFREELQVEVYNVFLRKKKVSYTTGGQQLLVSAAAKICAKYTRNKTFADREVEDLEVESGIAVLPATDIVPTSVAFATASERASRLAPPIQITAYEAGAMHKVNINVDVYS